LKNFSRGVYWMVKLTPATGSRIQKAKLAVVVNYDVVGKLQFGRSLHPQITKYSLSFLLFF
jgi:mRNA-degrading endonuclease toxin of MazEF toxin-antitoxin module